LGEGVAVNRLLWRRLTATPSPKPPREADQKFFGSFFQKRTSCLLLLLLAAGAPARDDVLSLSAAALPAVGFGHLPYANPAAPKGGAFVVATVGDFDDLNPFILRGTAPESVFRVWQPLFKPSDTDSVTAYAELARSVDVSGDGLTVKFHLNPRARFSDGVAVTAGDVVWTYRTLVSEGAPIYADLYGGVLSASAPDAETAVFRLRPGAGRGEILNLAEMYVLPEHFWKGRAFGAPLRDFPVGSGPYEVASVSFGDTITYRRVKNWWAADDPADVGFYNFDTVSEVFFHSDAVALQAFLAGQVDARIEPSAAVWATGYRVADARRGNLAMVAAPLGLPAGIHGFVMNTRRPVFADARVRRAMVLAFDFEWINRVILGGAERRETSYFAGSPMASAGLPSEAELRLLQPFRGRIPDGVFGALALPVTDGSGDNLPKLRQAYALLLSAGWRLKDWRLVDAKGDPLTFEILLADPKDEAIAFPYVADLRDLGVDAEIRMTDPSSYQRRLENYDFDMTVESVPATDYPDTEQADYWGCAAARRPGGYNYAGVCSPAIEAMIAAEIDAKNLADKTAAVHALDRLLLNGWYFVPWGAEAFENVAYWRDKAVMQPVPLQIGVDYDLWWAR